MAAWGSPYFFGIELEIIAAPHTVQHPFLRWVYYEKLAESLRSCGAPAIADRLNGGYSKHPEHYNKWWITKDGSLGDPDHPFGTSYMLRAKRCRLRRPRRQPNAY